MSQACPVPTPSPTGRGRWLPGLRFGRRRCACLLGGLALAGPAAAGFSADATGSLPGTQAWTGAGDLSLQMAEGLARYLDRATVAARAAREARWSPDPADPAAPETAPGPRRAQLARIIGAVDPWRPDPELEYVATVGVPALAAETDLFTASAVRWAVFADVHGEGLLLQPRGAIRARAVVLPDADQTPEMIAGFSPGSSPTSAYARRLAENGVQVIVPVLADRSDTFSGSPVARRWTNLPHREWLYRPAYILGRHVIGYEVQKIRSAIDWLARQNETGRVPLGVAGWGEGGLLALHAAALDPRIDAALVSGHFGPREALAQEPIYRNVFGLLNACGDAELAALIVPRRLVIEHAPGPAISGPPVPRDGRRNAAAPGRLTPPSAADVAAEVGRARRLAGPLAGSIQLLGADATAANPPTPPLADATLAAFLAALTGKSVALAAGRDPRERRPAFDPVERQRRTVREMERHTQHLLSRAGSGRDAAFWARLPPTTPEAWREAMRPHRERFWTEVIGRLPPSAIPPNPRARLFRETAAWTAHEVMLDVAPDVMAWGYLLLPKNLRPGEQRPVIVAQHGLNSAAVDVFDEDPSSRFFHQFQGFGARLAERGFIVFAPRNPYRGDDRFRGLQRQANPLGLSLFSFILAQHDRIIDWLGTLPPVDPARIGFYGLSYGGKTAMRVPALLERYAVSVCSGDFNEWIGKNAATDSERSYLFTNEYEMPEFNLGQTYSYAEMAALIAPRPFMVERGHDDTVGADEWVAFEYAKVRRLYDRLGIPGRTAIEYFNGPHRIHGVGTFQFLHAALHWPAPAAAGPP